jgi:ferrous iron transport protein B
VIAPSSVGPRTTVPTVVVAGNPNVGKSTLFSQLTGVHVRIGNYPGITVERRRARISLPDLRQADLVDSPGVYSLSARTRDELVALEAIAGLPPIERPALVIDVVDATQLTRNLYLTLQLLELDLPVVVALNMLDDAQRDGIAVDAKKLEAALGVPVVPIVARKGQGKDELLRQVAAALHDPSRARPQSIPFVAEGALKDDLEAIAPHLPAAWHGDSQRRRTALALWALLSLDDDDELTEIPPELRAAVVQRRAAAATAGRDVDQEVIASRYHWIDSRAPEFLTDRRWLKSLSDRIDRVLLSPWIGFPFFAGLMVLLFQGLFAWSDPLIGVIEEAFVWIGETVRPLVGTGVFGDFVQNGVIGGVGAFMVFLPQILLLSLLLQVMEDSGYMARVAVIMDRLMRALGLHGRAFVPMLSGYACAVPAILATRNMERQRDRFLTIMVLPFMTCSARLPVYALLIAAILPTEDSALAGAMMLAFLYLFGTVTALLAAWVLGRTLLKGVEVPLLIEMPPYRLPHLRTLARHLWFQGREFVVKAGTIILLCSMGMWALLEFPKDPAATSRVATEVAVLEERIAAPELGAEQREELAAALESRTLEAEAEATHYSLAGRFGRLLEPILEPLGFDWRIGVGIVGAFAAREVFVSTMGVVFGTGADVDEETPALRERLAAARWPDGRVLFTPLACISLMLFFALACQCMSTLATVKRETGSTFLTVFMFVYMTAAAWIVSFVAYQGGKLLGYE